MAALRTDVQMEPDRMLMIVANVPLMFEPNTTAPVYFGGNFAAIP